MIHPHTRLETIDATIGLGVVATQLIPKGTICWVLDPLDVVLDANRVAALPASYRPMMDRYAYATSDGDTILCWDHSRFVNHACEPTLLPIGPHAEVAIRDIQVGEQLVDDYGNLCLSEPMSCACGSPSCRGVVRPDDPVRLQPMWDAMVRAVVPDIAHVEQPLWHLLKRSDRAFLRQLGVAAPRANGVGQAKQGRAPLIAPAIA